jgi:hypothetical protein
LVIANIGVPAKKSKGDCFAPFSKAKLGGKSIKNRVFAVAPIFLWFVGDDPHHGELL